MAKRYWWVNQNQTFREETTGELMWSPQRNANGARNQFYDNMRDVSPGDVVFSFRDGRIVALGVATGKAQESPKPDFGRTGANWSNEGWLVPVQYALLENQIRPKEHIERLRPLLPDKYSPLRSNGNGLQSVYLAAVPDALGDELVELIGPAYWTAFSSLSDGQVPSDIDEFEESLPATDRTIDGPTFRAQLVKARRGQGIFRVNVLLRENHCRVTKVRDKRHLKASHIKPWRDSSDVERLDGANGLLLSPHIDHLFDQGYITFSAAQELIVVPEVRRTLLDAWGIDTTVRVGEFSPEQNAYLEHHRARVFRRTLLQR